MAFQDGIPLNWKPPVYSNGFFLVLLPSDLLRLETVLFHLKRRVPGFPKYCFLKQNHNNNTTDTGRGGKINTAVSYHFQVLKHPWENTALE